MRKKKTIERTRRRRVQRVYAVGQPKRRRKPSARRSRAIVRALKRESHGAVVSKTLARQARRTARRRNRA